MTTYLERSVAMNTFKDLIVEGRRYKGLSLRELSKLSGVPYTTIFHYETGTKPGLDNADKLLKALDISLVIGGEMNAYSTH